MGKSLESGDINVRGEEYIVRYRSRDQLGIASYLKLLVLGRI